MADDILTMQWSLFFFSSRRRHTRSLRDWSSDVCSSDLELARRIPAPGRVRARRHADARLAHPAHRVHPHVERPPRVLELRHEVRGELSLALARFARSEERRVGKEWRARWWADQ